jgi:hypothetical protein
MNGKTVSALNKPSRHRSCMEARKYSSTYFQLHQQKTEISCQFHIHPLNPQRETVRFLLDRKWSGPAAVQCLNRYITGQLCTMSGEKRNLCQIYVPNYVGKGSIRRIILSRVFVSIDEVSIGEQNYLLLTGRNYK